MWEPGAEQEHERQCHAMSRTPSDSPPVTCLAPCSLPYRRAGNSTSREESDASSFTPIGHQQNTARRRVAMIVRRSGRGFTVYAVEVGQDGVGREVTEVAA